MGKSKWDKYSNEELTNLIKDKYKNGILNNCRNLGTKTNTPDFSVLQRRFNIQTWNDFLVLIGLRDKILSPEEKVKISIQKLKELAKKLNRCPYVKEYKKYKGNGYDLSGLQKYLGLKYNDICRKYIPEYELNRNIDITIA